MKAWLLRSHVPLDASVPSVIVAKTTITAAQGLLLIVGLPCAWMLLPHDSPLLRVMLWMLVLEVLAVAAFIVFQVGGLLRRSGRWLRRVPFLARLTTGLSRLDDSLAVFYRREPRRLALSTLFHFLGWVVGAVEVWVALHLLGIEISLVTALLVEAFSTAIRFATFMVPASIGALEGGHVAMFAALGLGATTGLSFSIVRRIREATWIGIGFLALAVWRGVGPAPAAAREH